MFGELYICYFLCQYFGRPVKVSVFRILIVRHCASIVVIVLFYFFSFYLAQFANKVAWLLLGLQQTFMV